MAFDLNKYENVYEMAGILCSGDKYSFDFINRKLKMFLFNSQETDFYTASTVSIVSCLSDLKNSESITHEQILSCLMAISRFVTLLLESGLSCLI